MIQRQQAKEKLHKLVAPLLAMHNPDQLSLQALGAIQPKLNLSFSELGATLKDGTIILQGVTGHFNHAKVTAPSFTLVLKDGTQNRKKCNKKENKFSPPRPAPPPAIFGPLFLSASLHCMLL